jgi:hypothetical protein
VNAEGHPANGRGAPRRVAEVHAQTRRGLTVASVFTMTAAITGVAGVGTGWWPALHLFVVGGLLSAISATTQMLAVTWSAGPPPRPAVAGTQRWALAVGTVALVVGRETDRQWLFVAGAVAAITSMLGLAAIVVHVRRRSVTDRFAPAIDAYVAAIVAGSAGMSLGVLLGTGHAGRRAAEFRNAHLLLNVFGLVGLVIAGTLPFLAATQVRSKMPSRATAVAMRTAFLALAAATAGAAAGAITDRPGVVAAALAGYAIGLLAVAAMLPVYATTRLRWAGPRAIQLLTGIGWWIASTVALAHVRLSGTDDGPVLRALMIGGFAQILVASLAYLGPVLRGPGHQRLTGGFAATRSWVSLAAGNLAGAAALTGHHMVLAVAMIVWLVDIVARTARLLTATRADATPAQGT